MADLSGIIPSLPSGGTYSNRQQYKNGMLDYGFGYYQAPYTYDVYGRTNIDNPNQKFSGPTAQSQGGYIYGKVDPNNPEASFNQPGNFRWMGPTEQEAFRLYGGYMTPDKIIPSQLTQTPAQTVGPAQFQIGGQTATAGTPTQQRPFEASAPSVAQSTQSINPAQQGFIFGDKFMAGSFGNNTPGQKTAFYADQPSSVTAATPGLGTFSQWTPQQQALIKSRGNP